MNDFMHKEFPKTVGRTEFWKQIKRTVNGKEVEEEDIQMIISQIKDKLKFDKGDHLLDLGCGNAALSSNFFREIKKYTGVDFSSYLLEVATEFFKPSGNISYVNDEILNFVNTTEGCGLYSKALVYGAMAYLSRQEFSQLVDQLNNRFVNCRDIFIGNIPNKHRAAKFYRDKADLGLNLENPKSPIGVWWTPEEIQELGHQSGFEVEVLTMPPNFYASEYRFDVSLTRR